MLRARVCGSPGAQSELIREDLPNSRCMAQRCLILRVADGASAAHGRGRGTPARPAPGCRNDGKPSVGPGGAEVL